MATDEGSFARLSLAAFLPAARALLEDLLADPNTPDPAGQPISSAARFDDLMAHQARDDAHRAAEAFLYDMPALIAYGMRDPDRSVLDGSPEERFALAAAWLESDAPSRSGPLAMLEQGDPDGLRREALTGLLRGRGVDLDDREALGKGLVRLVEDADRFLAAQAGASSTASRRFTEWALKTTTLTAFAAKIGLLTDRTCRWIAGTGRWPGRAASTSPRRVLVVGPGIDLINRHLGPRAPVACYQPIELGLSLLRHGLVDGPAGLRIDALDINPLVWRHLAAARARARTGASYPIVLFAFARPSPLYRPEVSRYIAALLAPVAGHEGTWMAAPHRGISLEVEARIVDEATRAGRDPRSADRSRAAIDIFEARVPAVLIEAVRPLRGDIVCDDIAPPGSYALALCTNVLRYFEEVPRRVALLNIRRMLRRGGFLVTTFPLVTRVGETELGLTLRRIEKVPGWDPQFVLEATGEGF